jgi:hypothetical protein
MKKEYIKKTAICTENGTDFYNKWFSCRKEKSFIKHVDTLYFMVMPDIECLRKSNRWENFIEELRSTKEKADLLRLDIPIFNDIRKGLETKPYMGAQLYSLHFGLKDNFDIFTSASTPNNDTPPIMIQIRSNALWLEGMKGAFNMAYDCIERVLGKYNIKIKSIQENRIDYAFHTNYINDFLNFFPEKDLKKMQISNFRRGRKDFNFHTCDEDESVDSDYFTLGRHKSNNAFFRAYNKTKEVIEMGYKQFFIPIWKKYGLINDFDEYVLKRAFIYGTYESKDKARCEFYYDYGKDNKIRDEIYEKLQNKNTPAKWFAKRAKGLVPEITIISNIEIQTKRKFYDRLKLQTVTADETPRKNIYNIFEQMSELIRFITSDTIRFVKYKGKYADIDRTKRPMADWWVRLRSARSVELTEEWEIEYIRHYQYNLDLERQKLLSIKKMANMGAYLGVQEGEFNTDVERIDKNYFIDVKRFYENMNDNDWRKYNASKKHGVNEILRKMKKQNEPKKEALPPKKRE